jgi:signal peptidase
MSLARKMVRGARRWASSAALGALVVVLAAGILLVLLYATGHRALIVRSGSMEPAIKPGDLAITRLVEPAALRVGDIVTFRDSTREGELVTHRVIQKEALGEKFAFVTGGDANTGRERWSVAAEGTSGRFVIRIPRAGYALAWVGLPAVRATLVGIGALLLAGTALRRVWSPRPATG